MVWNAVPCGKHSLGTTLPKTTCFPLSHGVSAVVMKNCVHQPLSVFRHVNTNCTNL